MSSLRGWAARGRGTPGPARLGIPRLDPRPPRAAGGTKAQSARAAQGMRWRSLPKRVSLRVPRASSPEKGGTLSPATLNWRDELQGWFASTYVRRGEGVGTPAQGDTDQRCAYGRGAQVTWAGGHHPAVQSEPRQTSPPSRCGIKAKPTNRTNRTLSVICFPALDRLVDKQKNNLSLFSTCYQGHLNSYIIRPSYRGFPCVSPHFPCCLVFSTLLTPPSPQVLCSSLTGTEVSPILFFLTNAPFLCPLLADFLTAVSSGSW